MGGAGGGGGGGGRGGRGLIQWAFERSLGAFLLGGLHCKVPPACLPSFCWFSPFPSLNITFGASELHADFELSIDLRVQTKYH